MHIIVMHERVDVIAAALEAGIPADGPRDEDNRTLLMIACRYDFEMVDLLLRWGADVNHSVYIRHPPRDNIIRGDTFETPLIEAVDGDAEVVRLLLEANAEISVQVPEGADWGGQNAPFTKAMYALNAPVVSLLIDAGADITQHVCNRPPLFWAVESSLKWPDDEAKDAHAIAEKLLQAHTARGTLNEALEERFELHRRNESQEYSGTVLHHCAKKGSAEMYKLLRSLDAPLWRNREGRFPLHLARDAGMAQCIIETSPCTIATTP